MTENEIPRTIRFFWDHFTLTTWKQYEPHCESPGARRQCPTDVEYRCGRNKASIGVFAPAAYTRDESGRPILLAGVLQDITDRKQTEQALAERLRFEKLLADLSATFVNLPSDHIEV